jgi:hypothetical protein
MSIIEIFQKTEQLRDNGLYPSLKMFEKTQTGLAQSALAEAAEHPDPMSDRTGFRIMLHNVNKSIKRVSLMFHKRICPY